VLTLKVVIGALNLLRRTHAESDLTLAFDQYKQDQNVYLRHEEHKEEYALEITYGLSVIARPDWTEAKEEYRMYDALGKLTGAEREAAELSALRAGKLSTTRVFDCPLEGLCVSGLISSFVIN